jgi:hypothetical protein
MHGSRQPELLARNPGDEWEIDRDHWLAKRPGVQITVPLRMRDVILAQEAAGEETPGPGTCCGGACVAPDFGTGNDDAEEPAPVATRHSARWCRRAARVRLGRLSARHGPARLRRARR